MNITIDPKTLVHSFEYHEYVENDAWRDKEYEHPQIIENVRIDFTDVYSKSNNDSKIVANAVIFCYASHTTPFLNFKKRSKITAMGRDYELKKVILLSEPYSDRLFGIELEILGADDGGEFA